MIRILVRTAGPDSPVVAEARTNSEALAEDLYAVLTDAMPDRFIGVVIPE